MTRRLGNIAILLVAIACCYGMQATKPRYAQLIGPIPSYGKPGEKVATRTFDIDVGKVTFARTLTLNQFGKRKLLTTGGVWAIVTAKLVANGRSTIVGAATWRGPDGLDYRTTERVSSAAGATPVFLDPGLPGEARFVFEILAGQASNATLLVSGRLVSPLDSQAHIALGPVTAGAGGLPEGTLDTYDLGEKF